MALVVRENALARQAAARPVAPYSVCKPSRRQKMGIMEWGVVDSSSLRLPPRSVLIQRHESQPILSGVLVRVAGFVASAMRRIGECVVGHVLAALH